MTGPAPTRSGSTIFKEQRDALFGDTELRGSDFARAYAALADDWLRDLLGDEPGVTLVALGGYGRAELCPHSDLDVLLVHDGHRDLDALANRIWYPIWDAGIRLDHSARTARETLRLVRSDLKVAMGLLDARAVAGPPASAEELKAKATSEWKEHGRRFLDELSKSTRNRHTSFGDVAFLLEPDLKEAKGGLRDLTALRAADVAAPFAVRVDLGDDAAEVLLSARIELHRASGRPNDRLLLQDQDDVAARLGYRDADAFMAAIAGAARRVAWLGDDAWRSIDAWVAGPSGSRTARDREVGPGLVIRDGELRLTEPPAANDDSLALRAAAAAATHGARLGHDALARLAKLEPLGGSWPAQARQALVELLGSDELVTLFEALDQYGVWTRLIPEWEPVRSRPQRNAYHRFTVDRHLVEATRNAAAIRDNVGRPDLLLVGALLHDIGKGYPGDHSVVGAELTAAITSRMGFPADDIEILERIVRLHLLLPDVAGRRDLDDPGTIDSVADQVVDITTLELLSALSEADAEATGDAASSPWKRTLLGELVERVRRRLEGRPHRLPTDSGDQAHLLDRAGGRLLVVGEDRSVQVVAPDRPGLVSAIAGVLALNGLAVVTATLGAGRDGMVVDAFRVEPIFARAPDWSAVERDLSTALAGELSLGDRLQEKAHAYRPRSPTAARPAVTDVMFDNDLSAHATVIEVRAPDAVGLLYRITSVLSDLGLDIRHATVSTVGHQAVDGFYVVDASGSKLSDPQQLEEVEAAIRAEVSPDGGFLRA